MGKASSAKKVARAARAGGTRRAGQRRPLGFPITVAAVVILGVLLVGFARNQRDANAKPEVGDHWHAAYGVFTCIAEEGTDQPTPPPGTETPTTESTTSTSSPTSTTAPATTPTTSETGAGLPAQGHLGVAQDPTSTTTTAPAATTAPAGDSTTTTTTTTTAPTPTTLNPDDAPGEFQAPLNDAFEDAAGIHTHGDNVIHIHPFQSSVAGRKATLDKFMSQVGVVLTDESLSLPSGQVFTEGRTKCEGGTDGIVEVAVWDKASDATNGSKPNNVITSDVGDVHLENGQALTIAFMPEGQGIPADKNITGKLEELGAVDSGGTTTTTEPGDTSDTSTTVPGESTTTTTIAGETTTTTAPPPTSSP